MILIVAGVSGSGKTTIGIVLGRLLHWPFVDGDSFHSAANVAKMRSGVALTDEDRQPWLHALCEWMDARIAAGQSAVLACSALKRAYRDELLSGRPQAVMVFLEVDKDVLRQRLRSRRGHFFPPQLLESQLDILEPAQADERVLTVTEADPAQTAAKIITLLRPPGQPGTPESPAPGAV